MIAILIASTATSNAQVVDNNFDLFFNQETNPSILANKHYHRRIVLSHENHFIQQGSYHSTGVQGSVFLPYRFTGIGVRVTHNFINDSAQYQIGYLGAGYRNILFGKYFIRIGANYKFINNSSSRKNYNTYFNTGEPLIGNTTGHGVDYSISIAKDQFRYAMDSYGFFLVFSSVNNHNFFPDESITFPKYLILHGGNVANLFARRTRWDLAFSIIRKTTDKHYYNPYMYLDYMHRISRRRHLKIGGVISSVDYQTYQAVPRITLMYSKLLIGAAGVFGFKKEDFSSAYKTTFRFDFTYKI